MSSFSDRLVLEMNVLLTVWNLMRDLIVHGYSIFLYFFLDVGNENNYYIPFLPALLLSFSPFLSLYICLYRMKYGRKKAEEKKRRRNQTMRWQGGKKFDRVFSVNWNLIYIRTSVFYHPWTFIIILIEKTKKYRGKFLTS